MIFSSPPQFGQCSRSRSNTRLSSRAQLSRTGLWCAQIASHSAGGAAWAGGSRSCSTTSARSLALGARTPWFAKRGSAHFAKRSYADTNADQVQPRPWHQCRQPQPELQRRHHQMRGAVAPGGLELQHHLSGGVRLHALVGQCRAGDVTAQVVWPTCNAALMNLRMPGAPDISGPDVDIIAGCIDLSLTQAQHDGTPPRPAEIALDQTARWWPRPWQCHAPRPVPGSPIPLFAGRVNTCWHSADDGLTYRAISRPCPAPGAVPAPVSRSRTDISCQGISP